jgi:hypothetical protein
MDDDEYAQNIVEDVTEEECIGFWRQIGNDLCGVCDGDDAPNTGNCDCNSDPYGLAIEDCNGDCGGDLIETGKFQCIVNDEDIQEIVENVTAEECLGVWRQIGNDLCGVCGGDDAPNTGNCDCNGPGDQSPFENVFPAGDWEYDCRWDDPDSNDYDSEDLSEFDQHADSLLTYCFAPDDEENPFVLDDCEGCGGNNYYKDLEGEDCNPTITPDCWLPGEYCDCEQDADGSFYNKYDCAGVCGGTAVEDCAVDPDDESTWDAACGGYDFSCKGWDCDKDPDGDNFGCYQV